VLRDSARFYCLPAMQSLLEKSSDVHHCNLHGENAIFILASNASASWNRKRTLLELLVRHGLSVNKANYAGLSPLHISKTKGAYSIILFSGRLQHIYLFGLSCNIVEICTVSKLI
jgi:hypothetical protein